MMFASFTAALFIAGGSGISFVLAALKELIQKDLQGACRIKALEVVWVTQQQSSLNPLFDVFAEMLEESTHIPLKISVHYTRAGRAFDSPEKLPSRLTLSPGRPDFISSIHSLIDRVTLVESGAGSKCGLLVGVCGPTKLADDVSSQVGMVDARKRDLIGGVEVCHEYVSLYFFLQAIY